MLCPTGYSNPDDVAECRTRVCTYLEFKLLDRLLWFIDGIRTAIIISIHLNLQLYSTFISYYISPVLIDILCGWLSCTVWGLSCNWLRNSHLA